MGGIQYVYWPGTTTRLTPWMLYCLTRLDADLRRLFGVHLVLDSSDTQRGIRTEAEQTTLFLSRYSVQWWGSGLYGDVRWWKGKRYVRHSGLGTVAQPKTSNHEIQQGYYGAVDLADSGGPGIGTMGSARSNWLKANAARYGLEPEGFKFKEAWHYRIPNIFRAAPSIPAPPAPPLVIEDEREENTMKVFGYKKPGDTRTTYVEMDFAGGLWHEFVTDDTAYAVSVADKWGGGAPLLSTGHRNELAERFDARWPGMRLV